MSAQLKKQIDKASDWALRIGGIADNLCGQMVGRKIEFREQFLMGAMGRQASVLRDVSRLLKANSERNMTSVFILFRCLLDDYLTILYFADADFDEERFIEHTANAHNKRMSMTTESRKINNKFFKGKHADLATVAMEQKEREDFKNAPDHGIFYKDQARTDLKGFRTTSSIVGSLTVNEENTTAAHSFAIWKLLSTYVHYSHLTYEIIKKIDVRKIEIEQLPEILYYCLRCIELIYRALKTKFARPIQLIDKTHVMEELTEGFNELPH